MRLNKLFRRQHDYKHTFPFNCDIKGFCVIANKYPNNKATVHLTLYDEFSNDFKQHCDMESIS